ncbi:MAG: preprotein translocase subunit SecA [Deltaproteobacteria bacterium]|jgi:preprotein translocase subunit SecA|nr:preprotein translocase subunit SecA [Deltaproteobacteria bacterium]
MPNVLKAIFGSANDREISRLAAKVDRVNELEEGVRRLPDEEFPRRTALFRERVEKGESLDSVLFEAFALCREAAARVLGQRHFDVQLMGGLVLHDGKIAEMKTGEGKTLAATLPVYLNSLSGKGVHVVTVNDYLASRDAEWMGQVYGFLGCSAGVIVHSLNDDERREAYARDVTYGTNHELGFDYLRDNMKFTADQFVQRGFNYAIVDEVDSILIDEARTPLIISGRAKETTKLYVEVNAVIPRLAKELDYTVDEKSRTSILTERGVGKVEKMLGVGNLYDSENIDVLHHVNQALKAHTLFRRDSEYMVENGKVVIVDEFTGRPMEGRRFSDGLHQALEAKEGVRIENENQTLASITYQNYFRMYDKLAGMTGTADTEAAEFSKIYNLDVVVLPTHRRMIRADHPDVIYRTQTEKYRAVVEHIAELHDKGQPVLVGTISINNSEKVSRMLSMEGVPHQVLNAKHHEREAQIVAKAGQPGAVTISTNMAGRGTDIVLGPGVPENGGLFILGTERHESRRIDNQLRGRSGRQGDPGESMFYLSLEDDLMRIFGGGRLTGIMKTLGMTEGVPISAPIISRSIENAQKHVESRNFDIRKHLLEYDDVMNRQRVIIYSKRRKLLFGEDYVEDLLNLIDEESQAFVMRHMDGTGDDGPNWAALELECRKLFGFAPDRDELESLEGESRFDYFYENGEKALKAHLETLPEEFRAEAVRTYMLRCVDSQWEDHLLSMDYLKSGVSLRGYAQKDPLREYQREGFDMFTELLDRIRSETLEVIFSLRPRTEEPRPIRLRRLPFFMTFSGGSEGGDGSFGPAGGDVKVKKVGRNEPCPCGSGKKYKHCHGRDS